jgi:acyl-CoA synthetase (NDP forming)/L-amino acid N-acyltransferase YncA
MLVPVIRRRRALPSEPIPGPSTDHADDVELGSAFERDVTLNDGSVLRIRPVRPEDREGIRRLHDQDLSDTSAYFRFFGARPHLTDSFYDNLTAFDPGSRASLVAVRADRLVGIGSYSWERPRSVEGSFTVADAFHGLGIGTLLLEDLAVLAREAGYHQMTAHAMAGNRAMLNVFAHVGLRTRRRLEGGIVDLEMDLQDVGGLAQSSDEREWAAQAASMHPFLAPRSVVVIGASRDPASPGHRIAANARRSFTGELAVVRPDGASVAEVPGYTSVGAVPFPVDLAVIAVPPAVAPQVIEECGAAGVKAVVVITAGFSETGAAGATTDSDLVAIAHRSGMRLLGPNCFGVIAPAVGLDATFDATVPTTGGVAFGSQSGGLGVAVIAEAAERGIGLSSFVSLGNRADVSSNDLLCAWAEDPATRVILLYLESIGNPRRFLRIARHVSATKPIVILKAGRSVSGQRGAASHTAALASDDAAVAALLEAAGVIRVDSLEEMLDVAQLLDRQPAATGNRVALIGNSGGPLILAADAGEARGLCVPTLSEELQAGIRALVPRAAATANPVDLLSTVRPEEVAEVVELVAQSGEVDAVVVTAVGLRPTDDERFDDALSRTDEVPPVPVAVSVAGVPARAGRRPVFRYGESAVDAVAHGLGWARRRRNLIAATEAPEDQVDWLGVRRLVRAEAVTAGWLAPDLAEDILAEAGIEQVESGIVRTAEEAAEMAERFETPTGDVVMKAIAPGLLHKSDAGGVILGVRGRAAAAAGFALLAERVPGLTGVLVQTQVPAGPELLIGARQDATAGPLVVVAAGGVEADLIRDRVVRAAPVSMAAAREMLLALRTSARLTGYRGRPAVDLDALAMVVVRVARLVTVVPEVIEFEINPLIAGPEGATAVDVRMYVDRRVLRARPLRGS